MPLCSMQASKFQKEMQLGWHGMAIALDKAMMSDTPLELTQETLLRNVYADSNGEVSRVVDWILSLCCRMA